MNSPHPSLRHSLTISGIREKAGIYFLFSGDELVYIGQTTNLLNRLAGHADKQFDRIELFSIADGNAMQIERELILIYRPKLNIEGNPDCPWSAKPPPTIPFDSISKTEHDAHLQNVIEECAKREDPIAITRVMKILGYASRESVYRATRQHGLPCRQKENGRAEYYETAIHEWMRLRTTGAAGAVIMPHKSNQIVPLAERSTNKLDASSQKPS